MIFKKKPPTRQPRLDSLQAKRQVSVNSYYRSPRTQLDNRGSKKKQETNLSNQAVESRSTLSKVVNILIGVSLVILFFFATTMETAVSVQMPKDSYSYRPIADYSTAAQKLMDASLINQSKVFFRSQDFEREMIGMFPELRQAEAIIPLGGRKLTLALRIAPPLAYVYNGTERGLLDESGLLASKATVNTGEKLLTIRFSEQQQGFDVGSRILTTTEVTMIKQLQDELKDLRLKDKDTLSIREINFTVTSGQLEVLFDEVPFHVKMSSFSDGSEQIGALKAALTKLDREGTLPATYVDVRVSGRVFVL